MKFFELVSSVWKSGRSHETLLIIMPVYTEYQVLFEHLSYLSRQTFQKFDLIIILGNIADEKKVIAGIRRAKCKFGIIVAKRKEDTGPAGGFFTGQKYALENGYSHVIFAESDCYPVDKTLVQALYAQREKGYVCATVKYSSDSGATVLVSKGGTAYYTLFSLEILETFGLYFAPIYHGAEDWEYFERIARKRTTVGAFCVHPYSVGDKTHRKFDRYWLYLLNTVAISTKSRFFYNFFKLASFALIMFFFFPQYGRKAASTMLRLLLSFTYGKRAQGEIKTGYEEYCIDGAATAGALTQNYGPVPGPFAMLTLLPDHLLSNFRKEIRIDSSYSDVATNFLAISAKKLYYKVSEDSYLLLADNSNWAIHLAKLLLFILAFPLFLLFLILIFIPVKLLHQPKTLKYGLD